jgi:hypothetical protein
MQLAEPEKVSTRGPALLGYGAAVGSHTLRLIARRRELEEASVGRDPSQTLTSALAAVKAIGVLRQGQEDIGVAR